MIKAFIKPEDWEELKHILCKLKIGYTVSFEANGKDLREMLVAINPISVQYYNSNDFTKVATGVPKAKWEKDGHGHKCSNCDEYANSYEDGYSRDHEFLDEFCSHCGAEMENWE